MTSAWDRFQLIAMPAASRQAAFARDVAAGLAATPKRLSCCYFYDQEGSRLFEAICELPEYYLTRAEAAILKSCSAEIAGLFPAETLIVELGSGNSAKTRLLLEAFLRTRPRQHYVPVDICRTVLEDTALELLRAYPTLDMTAVAAEYDEALRQIPSSGAQAKLVLWLGSNVGNFDRPDAAAFLRRVRAGLTAADRLLVGIDLRKERAVLEPAYDDAQGVTAAFNLNLLNRINAELDANFDLSAFRHRAVYNEEAGRVEMYLVSRRAQRVAIRKLEKTIEFRADEAIHTENSYKYSRAEIEALAAAAGLTTQQRWLDREGRFSLNLFAPA